jgi:hypothetical protein
MKGMNFDSAALAVPQFIITGAFDDRGGTQRPWDYLAATVHAEHHGCFLSKMVSVTVASSMQKASFSSGWMTY